MLKSINLIDTFNTTQLAVDPVGETIDTSSITATATSTRTSTVTATATATTSLLLYSTPPCRHERKY